LIKVDGVVGRGFMIACPGPDVRDIECRSFSIVEETRCDCPYEEKYERCTDHETCVHGRETVCPFDGMHIRK
jgi:hypothetical protein